MMTPVEPKSLSEDLKGKPIILTVSLGISFKLLPNLGQTELWVALLV